MPRPLEICLEDLDLAEEDERYLRCVALPGGEPGLALDRAGAVRWMPGPQEERAVCGLWVSADDRLVLLRGQRAGPVAVERAGRRVQAPEGKPVILLDQDLLLLDSRRLRVHVHGPAEAIYAPEPLTGTALGRLARAAATALALGAAVGVGSGAEAGSTPAPVPIEVRARPPKPVAPREPLECVITTMRPASQGPLRIHARCPGDSRIVPGLSGQILDPRTGGPVKDGAVQVKTVNKGQIVAEAPQLKKPVAATRLQFWVRRQSVP